MDSYSSLNAIKTSVEQAVGDARLVKEAWKLAERVTPIKSGELDVMSSAYWKECRNVACFILMCHLPNYHSMYSICTTTVYL